MPLEIRLIEDLTSIRPEDWNACFTGEAEDYFYLRAVDEAGLKGFNWFYLTAWDDKKLIAAMAGFFSDYDLDTTLQGGLKKITTAVKSKLPNLLKLKLSCLGSPCTETGHMGFHPSVTEAEKPAIIQQMLEAYERAALERGTQLISIKDIPETLETIWKPALDAQKYAAIPGMPTAYLDIDFKNIDEYLARLSAGTRKDMRRKLKITEMIRIETVDSLTPETAKQVMELYYDTRSRSEWQFEELTENYFRGVPKHMPGRGFCTLYYVGEELLAANLLIRDEHTLLDKFFCMNNEKGREYNLYFISWFTNIGICLKHGLKCYKSGQANYENKLRLGSKLIRNNMYFKHRNGVVQRVFKLISPFFGADETLKEAA